jgi:hypothetical protein
MRDRRRRTGARKVARRVVVSKRAFDRVLSEDDRELLAELRATLVQPCSETDAISYALRAAMWMHRMVAEAPGEPAPLRPGGGRRR